MTRELFGVIVIYGLIITIAPLVLYQMGYEVIQWIKKRRRIKGG